MRTSLSLGGNILDAGYPATGDLPVPEKAEVDPMIGKVLNGRFTVLELIGSGGMGKVYKAIQAPLDRIVALKILNPHYSAGRDPGFQKRFFFEASMTAKLHHPNTITILDYGRTKDGIFYIAMEHIQGVTLAEILASNGPLEWIRVINITQQICRSLREAHKMGIVHRDLKPANIMLVNDEQEQEQDRVKVLDFGLVKSFLPEAQNPEDRELTQAGVLLGSPMYMAPEQAKNQVDPRSDVYSVGLVVYQMLTGKPPFRSKEAIDIILKHVKDPPPPMRAIKPDIQVPRELEAVVYRCLEKDPDKRFQGMDQMLEGLRRAAAAGGLTGTLSRPYAVKPGSLAAKNYSPVIATAGNNQATTAIPPRRAREMLAAVPPKKKRDKLKLALISFAMIPALAAGLIVLRNDTEVREPAPAPAQVPAVPPVEPPTSLPVERMAIEANTPSIEAAPKEPPTPKMVHFVVSTEPSGASVTMDGRNLGKTPVEFKVERNQEGIATAQLVLSLEGFERTSVTASGSGPEVVLTQQLQKKSKARRSSSAAMGYKEDPYQ